MFSRPLQLPLTFAVMLCLSTTLYSQDAGDSRDPLRDMQQQTSESKSPVYGHWGANADTYSSWTNHSNRLIPTYTFGITLSDLREQGSVYTDRDRLKKLAGFESGDSHNPVALYFDQTDIYRLQQLAIDAGYSNIILMVFDGMDWNTTRAASIYRSGRVRYESGRGTGLTFQDDRRAATDFGLVCTSAAFSGARVDVNTQSVQGLDSGSHGGFDPVRGGRAPWNEPTNNEYLLGVDRSQRHVVTDSASSATSMCSGIKTFNGSINVAVDGKQVVPIARQLQSEQEFMVGLVTSVPVSHATPAAAYANNVTRQDYQDLTRDLVGLKSAAHPEQPLPGVDVLIGCGWGEDAKSHRAQGDNFKPGNKYFHQDDLNACDLKQGGRYRIAQRTAGKSGREILLAAADEAAQNGDRLIGFFGTDGGHLPFATADGGFNPASDIRDAEAYDAATVTENPNLADMTEAALLVLEQSIDGFWLMIEAGDVDWANHANNLDNSIGAVLSGEAAFVKVMDWVDENAAWDHTAVIVTADHGHYLVIDHPEMIAEAGTARRRSDTD